MRQGRWTRNNRAATRLVPQRKERAILTIRDHLAIVGTGLEWIVTVIELIAIAILLLGLVRFMWRFVTGDVLHRQAHERSHELNRGRLSLGRHILAALEVLIVADLIRTVLHLSIENIALLGILVLVRSFISFFLEYEIKALEKE